MSNVTKDSTLMCVRVTEPTSAMVGCTLNQLQERVARRASRVLADKIFEEGQVVIQQVHPFGQVLGSPDITYEVQLSLIPVMEHEKHVRMLQDELLGVCLKLQTAEETIIKQAAKIRKVKMAVEAKL